MFTSVEDHPAAHLPHRYKQWWREPFEDRVFASLRPNMSVLDVGSSRRPALTPDQRPPGCHYVGLDISDTELRRAPEGSYDEIWVSDVTERVPELDGRFDLIVSWQVLEHVRSLDRALANMYAYLRPGGSIVAQFSGKYSVFGVINSIVPQRFGVRAMEKLLRRDPATVFPAYYDRCSYDSIRALLDGWSDIEVAPQFHGATYLGNSRTIQRLYRVYENWAARCSRRNLATHYVVNAVR